MRAFLAVAASLLLAQGVRGESFTLRIQESAIVEIAGATAAYTTNPLIADVTTAGAGRLTITGHTSGTTQLMVITAGGVQAFLITVAVPSLPSTTRPDADAPLLRYDGRYSSGAARMQNTVDLITGDAERRSEIFVLHNHNLRTESGQPSDVIASIFYRVTTPTREFTLLDEMVDVSRLTISNTLVRGVHLREGPLELHAGYASSSLFDSFSLPAERRWVGGAGYGIDYRSTRWTPSVYGFFSEPAGTAARSGIVAALAAERRDGDTLFLRADLGVSRSLAASGEVRYSSPLTQFRAFLSLKPKDFPNLGLADVPGSHLETDLSRRATDRLSITSYVTFDRFDLTELQQTIGFVSLGLHYSLTKRFAILGGADLSSVKNPATSIRTIGLPVGVTYDGSAFGVAASYRLLDNSTTSRHGDILRIDAHTNGRRLTANAWAERQRQAPTLDLIFNADPALQLALLRLGITARSPADVARALRDNAALIDLGLITGVHVDLPPRRLQAGFNLGWLGSSQRSDHLRLVGIYDHDEGISTTRDRMIATLSYSRRILSTTDLYGAYTWWHTTRQTQAEAGTSVELGLRQQFSGLPNFLQRSGTIGGFVFLDPEMKGVRGPSSEALPDITVTLDDGRTARTDRKGAYTFEHVAPGAHRVVAQLPASPRAFFTTPARSITKVPAHIDFGLVWAAARIDGRVISDAGIGIPGVVLSAASRNGPPVSTTSDAEGRFVFALTPGTFRVSLSASSLPAGYSIAGQYQRDVAVEPDQPQTVSFDVQAMRTIAGLAPGVSEVQIESLGRKAGVNAAGIFVFRSMPSGTFTITARNGGRTIASTVTLPPEPANLRDVVLAAPVKVNATSAQTPVSNHKEASSAAAPFVQPHGTFLVQAGAFREEPNAAQLLGTLRRNGDHPFIVVVRGLTLVCIGPFETRREAIAARDPLLRSGFAGFVTRR